MRVIKKVKYLINYLYRNLVYPKVLNFRYSDILSKNKKLKNLHGGKRCFILGNGPSIKDININLLKNDEVFVVNDFMRHPQFQELNPANYVMSDTGFFNSKQPTDYFGKNLKEKSDRLSKNTKLFLNIQGRGLIEQRKLFQNQNVYYLSSYGHFSEYLNFNIEIDRTIPFPKNVILACLIIAVYMGFETIYLLGVEHDFLTHHFRPDALADPKHIFNQKYFYGHMGQPADVSALSRNLTGYEAEVSRVRQLFKNYRLFFEKAKKIHPKTQIYNATPNSYLDVFPFIKFEEIKF